MICGAIRFIEPNNLLATIANFLAAATLFSNDEDDMIKFVEKVYQQIATELIHAGFESTDIRMVRQIHINMQQPEPIECLGHLGQLAQVLLAKAANDPTSIESEA